MIILGEASWRTNHGLSQTVIGNWVVQLYTMNIWIMTSWLCQTVHAHTTESSYMQSSRYYQPTTDHDKLQTGVWHVKVSDENRMAWPNWKLNQLNMICQKYTSYLDQTKSIMRHLTISLQPPHVIWAYWWTSPWSRERHTSWIHQPLHGPQPK